MAKTKKTTKNSNQNKIVGVFQKWKIQIIGAAILIVALITTGVILNSPISKNEAATKFSGILDRYNSLYVDIKNDVSVLDTTKIRSDSEKMIEVIDSNINEISNTKWPEGLSTKYTRMNGDNVSDMELYVKDLEAKKVFYNNLFNAEAQNMLKVYKDDMPYGVVDIDSIRSKLGLPSEAAEKNKYHEYSNEEITEKLQETVFDVTIGKFYINCKTDYGYTSCDSNLDVAITNKSDIALTDGGNIEVTAYDNSNNPIDTETIYLGNRLEKGQTMKSKIFDYIEDQYINDFKSNPTFKITKIEIYDF